MAECFTPIAKKYGKEWAEFAKETEFSLPVVGGFKHNINTRILHCGSKAQGHWISETMVFVGS